MRMNKLYRLFITIIAFTITQCAFAQKDSIAQVNDSVNAANLEAFNTKIALIEQQRLKDSVKKAELEQQIQRSEEHTSELQSRENLVCRLLLEKKKKKKKERK